MAEKRKLSTFKLAYYPRTNEWPAKIVVKTFENKRALQRFIKEGLENATICSFYQVTIN